MPSKWLNLQNRRQQRAVDVASGAQENRGDRAAHTGRDGRPDRRHHSRLFDGRYGNRRYGYCLEEKEKGSRTMKKKLGLGLLLAVLACSVCASAFGAAAQTTTPQSVSLKDMVTAVLAEGKDEAGVYGKTVAGTCSTTR